ncbi:MAG: primosomal protein [Demequinaceae bacterium]|nr:primosomal protein [Demequinaceae bacterium]
MESDVREALRHLTTAFENHLEAVILRRGPVDAAVDDAYEALAEAFERYEDLLDSEYAEDLPLVVEDEDEVVEDVGDADFDEDEIEEDELDDDSDILDEDADEPEIEDLDEFDLRD